MSSAVEDDDDVIDVSEVDSVEQFVEMSVNRTLSQKKKKKKFPFLICKKQNLSVGCVAGRDAASARRNAVNQRSSRVERRRHQCNRLASSATQGHRRGSGRLEVSRIGV
jgi:hypothetical protein